ncbi:hypothetical protein [Paenibacillus sp. FSL P2-0173]|uniref:hypothetical protein n=1 Tax=Paenibacillus sp. FSL P2-0173 TaxID=2921627 RepID=UPI0030F6EF80
MRFYWIRSTSRACFIAAVVTRVNTGGMALDKAFEYTLSLERQAKNTHLISNREIKSLKRDIEAVMRRIEETRRAVPAPAG